jgi:hypothetical protein
MWGTGVIAGPGREVQGNVDVVDANRRAPHSLASRTGSAAMRRRTPRRCTFTDVRLLREFNGVVEAAVEHVRPIVLVAPAAPGITVVVDQAAGTLSVQGGWWYRGETSVRQHPRGTLVTYRILDVAPQGRWATWLVSRRPLRDAPAVFAAGLAATGRHLGVPAYVIDPDSSRP